MLETAFALIGGVRGAVVAAIVAALIAPVSYKAGHWFGHSAGREAERVAATIAAAKRIQEMEKNNEAFRRLPARDRCIAFMRDSGLSIDNCK